MIRPAHYVAHDAPPRKEAASPHGNGRTFYLKAKLPTLPLVRSGDVRGTEATLPQSFRTAATVVAGSGRANTAFDARSECGGAS